MGLNKIGFTHIESKSTSFSRFFAEFLTVLSRRVNPCPGVDDKDCADYAPLANQGFTHILAYSSSYSRAAEITQPRAHIFRLADAAICPVNLSYSALVLSGF